MTALHTYFYIVGLMRSAWKGSIVYKIYILFWDAIFILTHISMLFDNIHHNSPQ